MWNTSLRKTDFPLRIGITGGIGSGKTLVCSVFRLIGTEIFEADHVAKELYSGDENVKRKLTELFGHGIYTPDGILNRQLLAAIIFRDREALQKVNEIVHPLVKAEFEKWVQQKTGIYVLHEAAILFESGFYKEMDANILVTAPDELRIQRVMDRDHLGREDVLIRMQNQFQEVESLKLTDFVIRNDGSEFIIKQVLETDNRIRVRQFGKTSQIE
jgi:dephospho-CoA kinase